MTRFTKSEFHILSLANIFAEFRAMVTTAEQKLDSNNPDYSVAMPEYFDASTVSEEDEKRLVEEVREVLRRVATMLEHTEYDMICTTLTRFRED